MSWNCQTSVPFVLADQLRRDVLVLRGQVGVEQVGRLDHVVVHAHDDHVVELHRDLPGSA